MVFINLISKLMEIKRNIIQKHLHDIAIDQLSEEYVSKGYSVAKEVKFQNFVADLIATKGNETLILEVKTGKMTPQKRDAILKISEFVRQKENHKFKLVVATPPKDKKIEIFDIEEIFSKHFLEDFPSELTELSTHTRLVEVSDIDIDFLMVTHEAEILIKGKGVISVELQYGSDGDQSKGDGYKSTDSFPFEFDIVLAYDAKKKLIIDEIIELEVDVSSFYGADD